MPYVTTSRGMKSEEADELIEGLRTKSRDVFVARRGRKTIKCVVEDAVSKGFSKVIIVSKEKKKIVTKTMSISAYSFRWMK
jgi:rRNA maturation protein Rpf1